VITAEIQERIRERQEAQARTGRRRGLFVVTVDGKLVKRGAVLEANGTISVHRDGDPHSGRPLIVCHRPGNNGLVGILPDELIAVNAEAELLARVARAGVQVLGG
jgi:hypothetical protein